MKQIDINKGQWEPTSKKKTFPAMPSPEITGWNPLEGLMPPQIIRSFAGINTLEPFSIEENMMVNNKNISTHKFPVAAVRPGYTELSTTTGDTNGLAAWKGTELNAVSDGVWRRWNGSAWTTVVSNLNTTAKWSFTNFKGNFSDVVLLGANGVNPVKVYNGTTLIDLANAPVGLNYITAHENRLYGAVKNTLHYSGLRKPTDWTSVEEAGQIVIENSEGENISSIVNGTGKIVVFMPHSTHELYGTGPKNYRLQLVSSDIGCVSHQSAVNISGALYFLSHDGLYRYSGGAMPRRDFSLQVQAIIDRVNVKAWNQVVAGTDGEKYYISLPIDGAITPNITLEYDPRYEIWNVWDLGFSPSCYTNMEEVLYISSKTGKIVKMEGTKDGGANIPYLLETKPFVFNSLAQNSKLYRLWIVADVPTGATMTISICTDTKESVWRQLKTIPADVNLQNTLIHVPVDQNLFLNSKYVRLKIEGTGSVIVYEITRQERTFRMGIGGM